MLVIGENINATSKRVRAAIKSRDVAFVQNLAKAQADAGADYIDVNAGIGGDSADEDMANMEWLVAAVQQVTNRALSIDSSDPRVILAGLKQYRGRDLIVNSVTADSARLEEIGPIVAEKGALVVALAMDETGVPRDLRGRMSACDRIVEGLAHYGVGPNKVLFDPLVFPISVDTNNGRLALEAIEGLQSRYPGAGTVIGLSNMSHGLPRRELVNRAFMLMAAARGLSAVLADALDADLMLSVKAADMLLGKDPFCRGYLKAYRGTRGSS